jgi:hypothetical protein
MIRLIFILALLYPTPPVMPPPWEPPQPLTLPLRVEATGGADVLPIVRGDNQIASINIRPADGQACWRVNVWDQAGQQYAASSPRGSCGRRVFIPFTAQQGA